MIQDDTKAKYRKSITNSVPKLLKPQNTITFPFKPQWRKLLRIPDSQEQINGSSNKSAYSSHSSFKFGYTM